MTEVHALFFAWLVKFALAAMLCLGGLHLISRYRARRRALRRTEPLRGPKGFTKVRC